jgi:hypothetical protein
LSNINPRGLFAAAARPEAVETLPAASCAASLFSDRRHRDGSDRKTANEIWWS